jgi:deoxycytidine triphosphate deaminase
LGSRPAAAKTLDFVTSSQEAERRADEWEFDDPFDDLEPAMLAAPHILNYSRVASIIWPFDETRLKGATYEVGISGNAYYWDEAQKRRVVSVIDQGFRGVELPPNSITFVETDVEFRLPHYIAVRFNLHIKLVHRGLLLGTGPIVDPGFRGKLLIPLHNLTSTSYIIREGEKIVWVEFTKALFDKPSSRPGYIPQKRDYRVFPKEKRHLPAETYLWKANANNPIVSSIWGFITDVKDRIAKNEADVRRFEHLGWITLLLTVALGLGTAIAIYSNALSLIQDYEDQRAGLERRVHQLECRLTPGPGC